MRERIKVLVADDEQVIRGLLVKHLSSEGFTVEAVPSAEEALDVFKDDPDLLLITDIRMGGMSGVQLLQEVRKLNEEAQVIVITSHASLDNAVAALKAGAYDYLFKPFEDLDHVTQVVTRAVEKIMLLLENRDHVRNLEQNTLRIAENNRKLRELATRDGLTGLFNHRYFKNLLNREVARAVRYERALSLVILDVDHFKAYNDAYGQPAGDEVLKTLTDIITIRLRKADSPARYGGEEFAVLLPETDLAGAAKLAEDIRTQMENHPFTGSDIEHSLKITVSLGVAELLDWNEEPSSFLRRADEALSRAKYEGRNRVVCADEP